VAAAGGFAYVSDYDSGLRVFDISNPQNPFPAGVYYSEGDGYAVATAGNLAYLADWGSGVRIVNVQDPQNPVEVGYYDTPGLACHVAVVGNMAYVTDHGPGLRIIEYYGAGIEERLNVEVRTANSGPTIVRGALRLAQPSSSELLDVGGRTMMKLRPGANDVHYLATGVYFVREARSQAVRKVVIQR
jgi:hypothetical protein